MALICYLPSHTYSCGENDVLQAAFEKSQLHALSQGSWDSAGILPVCDVTKKHITRSPHHSISRRLNYVNFNESNYGIDKREHNHLYVPAASRHDMNKSSHDVNGSHSARPATSRQPLQTQGTLRKRAHTSSMPVLRLPVWIP